MIRALHVITSPIIFILFDNPDWQGGVLKLMKNDHFLVFLAVLEQLILELREMIIVLHVVAFPIDFNLFCVLGQELGVLKILLF